MDTAKIEAMNSLISYVKKKSSRVDWSLVEYLRKLQKGMSKKRCDKNIEIMSFAIEWCKAKDFHYYFKFKLRMAPEQIRQAIIDGLKQFDSLPDKEKQDAYDKFYSEQVQNYIRSDIDDGENTCNSSQSV